MSEQSGGIASQANTALDNVIDKAQEAKTAVVQGGEGAIQDVAQIGLGLVEAAFNAAKELISGATGSRS
jgi:hypothetical protein